MQFERVVTVAQCPQHDLLMTAQVLDIHGDINNGSRVRALFASVRSKSLRRSLGPHGPELRLQVRRL